MLYNKGFKEYPLLALLRKALQRVRCQFMATRPEWHPGALSPLRPCVPPNRTLNPWYPRREDLWLLTRFAVIQVAILNLRMTRWVVLLRLSMMGLVRVMHFHRLLPLAFTFLRWSVCLL